MHTYVIYYRVSTDQQRVDSQRLTVQQYLQTHPGEVLSTYEETESRTRNDRPILLQAMQQCRLTKATLLVSRLDRLGGNASFLNRLVDEAQNRGVQFVCCDSPNDSPISLRIKSVIAQEEVEKIRIRTREGMAAKRQQGVQFGAANQKYQDNCPLTPERMREMAIQSAISRRERAGELYASIWPLVEPLVTSGETHRGIAAYLNQQGIRTIQGSQWGRSQVGRMLEVMR